MVKMTKGTCGHQWNPEQNSRCPHCGVGGGFNKNMGENSMSNSKKADLDDEPTLMSPNSNSNVNNRHKSADIDSEQTIADWKKRTGIDPVVGWLVCIEGANQGRDYRIRSGYNTIGRDTASQVCIAGDETISRVEHAKIFFDPKNASFHVIAGSGRSGIYVNDKAVLQPTQIQAFDLLEIGNSKMKFIPFCGEHFIWEMKAS